MSTRRRKPRPIGTVVAYTRVSTSEQADSGAGLAAQEAAIRAEVERRGWALVRVYTDAGVSGASLDKRPALTEARNAIASGEADTLMVAKIDRLSRSLADYAGLISRSLREGWHLVALNLDLTTSHGRAMAGMLAVFSELEREMTGTRTREALAAKRARGVRFGRKVKLSAEVRHRIGAEREAGATLAAIAENLNSDGVPTAQGGASWYPSTVRAVLASIEADRVNAAVLASIGQDVS